MQRTEFILQLAAALGIVFYLTGLPEGLRLMIIGCSMLGLFYLFFGFALFNGISFKAIFSAQGYQGTNAKRLLFAFVNGFVTFILVEGILFGIARYSGAEFLLGFGLYAGMLILIISGILYWRKSESYYKRMVTRLPAFIVIAVIVYATPSETFKKLKENKEHISTQNSD